jgi:hypothetical protein
MRTAAATTIGNTATSSATVTQFVDQRTRVFSK